MRKVIFGVILLSFISATTIPSCTRAKAGCKKSGKKIKKMRKSGNMKM